jgi:hypothetical protein
MRRLGPAFIASLLCVGPASGVDILASRGDDGRTGANLRETLLTVDNVHGTQFRRLFDYPTQVDHATALGDVYAQPLVVSHVGLPNRGVRNLLIVATTKGRVVAFDADGPPPGTDGVIWKTQLGTPPTIEDMLEGLTTGCSPPTLGNLPGGAAAQKAGELAAALALMLTVPDVGEDIRDAINGALAQSTPLACTNIRPGDKVGIMSTPVVDRRRGIVFVSARTLDASGIHHKLHALDLRTGVDLAGSPIEMGGKKSRIDFEPERQNQRVGLALAAGHVIVAFGSHEDKKHYHGWVMSYRYDDGIGFKQTGLFLTTPTEYFDGCGLARNTCAHGGIWQTGRAPAVDADNRVLLFIGNGKNDLKSGSDNANFGNSFVALDPRTLDVLDFYTPANHTIPLVVTIPDDWLTRKVESVRKALLDAQAKIDFAYGIGINELDLDLGGSGPMIVPNSPFVIGGGKQGVMHVWRLDSLGGFSASDASVVQKFPAGDPEPQGNDIAGEDSAIMPWRDVRSGHIMGGPVYWPRPSAAGGSLMFNWSEDSELRSYAVDPQATPPINADPLAKGRDENGKIIQQGGHPGGILSFSANRTAPRTGIVWAATYDPQGDDVGALRHVRPGVLRAFDAVTLVERWNSDADGNRVGDFAKFVPPTVANGRVYLATFSDVVKVYGLHDHHYARPAAEIFSQAVQPLLEDPLLDN